MSHLEDKLAAFVYEELTASEMEEVRQHVASASSARGASRSSRKCSTR